MELPIVDIMHIWEAVARIDSATAWNVAGTRRNKRLRWPVVSQTDRDRIEAVERLGERDRVWLAQRLAEYRTLLAYLRDH